MHHADVRPEPLGQMLGKGGLAGAGASGDAEKMVFILVVPLLVLSFPL